MSSFDLMEGQQASSTLQQLIQTKISSDQWNLQQVQGYQMSMFIFHCQIWSSLAKLLLADSIKFEFCKE